MTAPLSFSAPAGPSAPGVYHARAAAGNAAVAEEAVGVLRDALSGAAPVQRILLKAAAGAGKSYVLRRLVADAIKHPNSRRVAIVAFTNKQIQALAVPLGTAIGKGNVCLFVAKDRYEEVSDDVFARTVVETTTGDIPTDCEVVLSTCHKLGAIGEQRRQLGHFGPGHNGETPYDVLFVDEAWQIPNHLFDKVAKLAPIVVGVGDVGQLPPLESGTNPWRGDPGYNPFRAWPTDYVDDPATWTRELPAVWRPAAGHLALWRAFYPEWRTLNCVAAPCDRSLDAPNLTGVAAAVWRQVGTGAPTLLEVDGLREPEAADIDLPLMEVVEALLDELFTAGFALRAAVYDDLASPTGATTRFGPGGDSPHPLVAILATRNQAVDDAAAVVSRLAEKHALTDDDLVSSTVDSYQGQTNAITAAVHPLTGAVRLDEFNSAFGRLAVTCTRSTHGLLMVTRPGLDLLLGEAPPRPGTPFGEPGNRQLPRQTHQRILATFARGALTVVAEAV